MTLVVTIILPGSNVSTSGPVVPQKLAQSVAAGLLFVGDELYATDPRLQTVCSSKLGFRCPPREPSSGMYTLDKVEMEVSRRASWSLCVESLVKPLLRDSRFRDTAETQLWRRLWIESVASVGLLGVVCPK